MVRHILGASDLTAGLVVDLCQRAEQFADALAAGERLEIARGKIMAALFYEPSTRTRLSHESAMLRLGGQVLTQVGIDNTSLKKGETLSDTLKMVEAYADVIVMRQPEPGATAAAAKQVRVPVVNAGDGPSQHPTQSLVDVYTMYKHFGGLDRPLRMGMVGDLKYGRTVHSLSTVLRRFGQVEQVLVAPPSLAMPEEYRQPQDTVLEELTPSVLGSLDVVYATRVQAERFAERTEYLALRDKYIWTPELVQQMKPEAILLHPLPRITEITPEVDALPQAHYFTQSANAVPARMALLEWVMGLD